MNAGMKMLTGMVKNTTAVREEHTIKFIALCVKKHGKKELVVVNMNISLKKII